MTTPRLALWPLPLETFDFHSLSLRLHWAHEVPFSVLSEPQGWRWGPGMAWGCLPLPASGPMKLSFVSPKGMA